MFVCDMYMQVFSDRYCTLTCTSTSTLHSTHIHVHTCKYSWTCTSTSTLHSTHIHVHTVEHVHLQVHYTVHIYMYIQLNMYMQVFSDRYCTLTCTCTCTSTMSYSWTCTCKYFLIGAVHLHVHLQVRYTVHIYIHVQVHYTVHTYIHVHTYTRTSTGSAISLTTQRISKRDKIGSVRSTYQIIIKYNNLLNIDKACLIQVMLSWNQAHYNSKCVCYVFNHDGNLTKVLYRRGALGFPTPRASPPQSFQSLIL